MNWVMMMMIAPISLARQKEVAQGEEEKEAGLKKGRPNKNCHARRRRFHMSTSVWDVGCEEQEKI